MLYAKERDTRFLSFEIEGVKINFVNNDGLLWFTKKELAKIFGVSKSEIKDKLSDIVFDEILVEGKSKKYYSLNKVIILGYRLKKFKETKTLNLLNMYVKVQTREKPLLSRVKTSITANAKILSNIVSI